MAALARSAAVAGASVGIFASAGVQNSQSVASPSLSSRRLGSPVSLSHSSFSGSRLVVQRQIERKPVGKLHCVAAISSPPKSDLRLEAERRWLAAHEDPMLGVSFTYEEFQDALANYDFNFEVGDTVKGVVFKADHGGALIDIGAKAPAFLPFPEACIYKVKTLEEVGLYPGMEEEFRIIRDDDDRGRMIISLRKIQYDLAWERCRQCLADDVTIRGRVLAVNRGGLLVQAEGLRGFVPTSHIALRAQKEDLIMQDIPLKFLEVEEDRTRLVLSNRRAMAETQQAMFNVGDVVVGTVQSVKPYGAFVDLGGANGLLHISQISHDRITNVETVLSEGDQLKVMILSQDRDRGRISLSTKKLEPTPGDMLRNPALVFEKADEMAKTFRERVAAAEAAARAEEQRLQQEMNLGGAGRSLDDLGLNL